jgi:pyruvate/2-oxoglutarate dehydrogenase complex dihydrolipoamide acyltransferase (E2) component
MSKVEFVYGRGGKKVLMARRYAETLRKLGHGTYAVSTDEADFQSRESKSSVEGPLASKEIAAFAEENKVDLATVTGTGKDGRIKKSDVEAVISSRDLV